jgi:predicted secreted hydrolase
MRLLGNVNWWMPARLKRLLPPLAAILLIGPLMLGCDASGRLFANAPAVHPLAPTPSPSPAWPADPQPVLLPKDEAPHDRLTEWWYYTGHLVTDEGLRFDFEFVIFRAERGSFPVTWASHLALTDRPSEDFWYEQRSEIGKQVNQAAGSGFDLSIRGTDDRGVPELGASPWQMSGLGGHDTLSAVAADFSIDLTLSSTRPDPVLHDTDGWVDFGAAGGSYYYSWPRMDVTGSMTLHGRPSSVTGEAWFDHQWGDFIAVGGGGWDWFAINLDDGTDLTLSLVRAADGTYPLVYGTLVRASGEVVHLTRDQFVVTSSSHWTSPITGAAYPAVWHVDVPGEGLSIDLVPTVPNQELDTRQTTGVVYWEGSQHVGATRNGEFVGGQGYVELTGYAPGCDCLNP